MWYNIMYMEDTKKVTKKVVESKKRGKGRPTKYKPDLIEKVDEYLKTCVEEVEDYIKSDGAKSTSYQRIVHANIPKRQGFASYIDVNVDTLNEWSKKYPDFSVALKKIDREQHNRLVEGGLSGTYSPVITKLMLSNNHGYREKSDVTTDGKELPTPLLSALDVQNNNSNKKDS